MPDPEFEQLRRKAAEIERMVGFGLPSAPPAARPPQLVDPTGASEFADLRAIILWYRPLLRIHHDEIEFGPDPISPELLALLTAHRARLTPAIAAVGCIKRADDPESIGNGWVISTEQDHDIIVTAAHVARVLAERSGSGFVFRRIAADPNQVGSIKINYQDDAVYAAPREAAIMDIVWMSDDEMLDVAFLRTARLPGDGPLPIQLASERTAPGRNVAVVGYPAYDSSSRHADTLNSLFGPVAGDKRFAPGQVVEIDAIGVAHDCSTLPGSSGSLVLDIETGAAAGLQYAESVFGSNYAVPAAALARLMRERPWQGQTIGPSPTAPIAAPADARTAEFPASAAAPAADGSIKLTVPLEISIKLGAPGQPSSTIGGARRAPPMPETSSSPTQPAAVTGMINRGLLGPHGFDLEEDEYVRAIAWLGSRTSQTQPARTDLLHGLRWSFEQFLGARSEPTKTPFELRGLGKLWIPRLRSSNGQLLIESDDRSANAADLFDIARILGHPAVALTSVAIDLEAPQADDKWRWPLRIGAFADDFAAFRLDELANQWPSSSLTERHELSREHARFDVLIIGTDVRGALQRILALPYRVRAGFLLLFTSTDVDWSGLSGHFNALLAETQSGGVSLVALPPARWVVGSLNEWVAQLSHNEPFDRALGLAFPVESSIHVLNRSLIERAALPAEAERLIPRLRELPAATPFSVPQEASNIGFNLPAASSAAAVGDALAANFSGIRYDHESWGATAISRLAAAEREARRTAASDEPSRYLQGDVFRLVDGNAVPEFVSLVVGQTYRFDVFIGEGGLGSLQMEAPFPAERLDWRKRESHTLQVIFAEPEQWVEPLHGTLRLPRHGRSTTAVFVFTPTTPGPFAGRVTALHRGRVLQTAVLATEVVATLVEYQTSPPPQPMQFRPEVLVRRRLSTLDDRRAFDAAVVLNHTQAGKSAMLVASERGAYISSLDGIAPQLQEINGLLNHVALNVNAHSGNLHRRENAELLVKLALQGCALHDGLVKDYIQRSVAASAIIGGDYLQIVSTKADALVPLEFIYEYKPPAEGAPVCANAAGALRSGRCGPGCVPTTNPAPHVCPLGFWGLRKVIERHVHEPGPGAAAGVLCESGVDRNTLKLGGPVLLAASKQVPDTEHAELQKEVTAIWKQKVDHVQTWTAWRQGVERSKPVLIVALPHAEGVGTEISLEISGDTLKGRYLDQSYVLANPDQPPIALLLGCDTVNVAYSDAYARHIAVFRRAGAALVVGTVATVFGKHAAKMAARVVDNLAAAIQARPGRFGEVLRQAKREAVANSEMIALCLVAFGDADWKLEA